MPPVSQGEVFPGAEGGARGRRGVALSREDCLCTVCLEIFLEPVTLPCQHTFCKPCFLESVDKAAMCCPLCRRRVSVWARQHSRTKTLVNEALWKQVQAAFPRQCQRRLSGQEGDELEVSASAMPRVSRPGEVRREYEDEISKLAEEKRALEEAESKASEEYIQRMLAEEEERHLEERRTWQEKQLQDDERMARLLSHQLNSSGVSQDSVGTAEVTPAKKKQKASPGQIRRFLSPLPPRASSSDSSPTSSFLANKENILHSQELPPDRSEAPCAPAPSTSTAVLSGDPGPSTAKRKSSELETTEEGEEAVAKRVCSSLHSKEAPGQALAELDEWEAEVSERRRQEEEDLQLALLLQKELDREEVQRATDRRKDSGDPYLLRQSHHGQAKSHHGQAKSHHGQAKSRQASTKSLKTSSPSSSSSSAKKQPGQPSSSPPSMSLPRGSKQATLTELFPSLGT